MNESVRIENLLKAQSQFESFRVNMIDDRDKAGAIQAFEFCYELAWKTMKRILAFRGQETGSPKDTFRKAALEKLIDDPETWFEFQKKRNLTVHVYDLGNRDAVLEIFDQFSFELEKLIKCIRKLS